MQNKFLLERQQLENYEKIAQGCPKYLYNGATYRSW
jgi:hypothetical protein